MAGLFAGIGGFERGFEQAGHRATLLCEIDPAARAVLAHRFPGVRLEPDVRTIQSLPDDIDVLTAGFPCQDLSQAGRTRGIEGDKSGIVSEVWRLLEQRAAPWVVLENVPFMLRLARGRALEVVVTRLERLGYRWAYRVLDSRAFELPQRRERVFIVASRVGDPRAVLLAHDAGEPAPERPARAFGFYWTEGNTGVGWAEDALPPLKGGSGVGIPSPPAFFVPPRGFFKPDIRDAERLQGFGSNWTIRAVDEGKPSHRWKLVGNAVSVPVARWIGERIRCAKLYSQSDEVPLDPSLPLPRAAWGDGSGRRFAVRRSAWPSASRRPSLLDFLKHEGEPLPLKAASGFLFRARRAEALGHLRFEKKFLDALSGYVAGLERSR